MGFSFVTIVFIVALALVASAIVSTCNHVILPKLTQLRCAIIGGVLRLRQKLSQN